VFVLRRPALYQPHLFKRFTMQSITTPCAAPVWQRPLATRFARNTRVLRANVPLSEDQMHAVAPSIFAAGKHTSRSDRYTHIPTIDVLRGLRRAGFEPFMVAQGHSRIAGKSEFTKHMIRMRHAGADAAAAKAKPEANEVVLINSHDGASSYQLLAGSFRYVCCNGWVVGNITQDIRIRHVGNLGDIQGEVIEGAFKVLNDFAAVDASIDSMKALQLGQGEQHAFASAALALRYDASGDAFADPTPPPITPSQVVEARRVQDVGNSLWLTMNRVQENILRGGQPGRGATGQRLHTRPVNSIDRTVSLNRALWVLAEEMRKIRA
jgi:Domain of unknown function (DUF932)